MFQLVQTIEGTKKVHEKNFSDVELDSILETYESLFNNLGFNSIVSVSDSTHLPVIKVTDNGKQRATLFFEKVA
jgi:hypothetical protein